MTADFVLRPTRAWDRFWFAPGTPINLAAARVLTASISLWLFLSRDLSAMSGVPAVFWSSVPLAIQRRFLLFPGHEPIERALSAVAVIALAGAIFGVMPRLSCCAGSLLLYHLAPLNWIILGPGGMALGFTIAVPALMILALSPCGDALSASALWSASPRTSPPWAYHWPVRLIQVLVVCIYGFAGYGKVIQALREWHHGSFWAASEQMRNWIMIFSQGSDPHLFPPYSLMLTADPVRFRFVWLAIVAAELTFPVALFRPRLRKFFLPAAFLFHAAILVTMNIAILEPLFLLLFVNWGDRIDRVLPRTFSLVRADISGREAF